MADLSPWEWLARLGPKLIAQHDVVQRWEDYYAGDQPGPARRAEPARRRLPPVQELARTNLCRLCVDSMVHRLAVVGFRAGDDGGNDTQIWDQWQPAWTRANTACSAGPCGPGAPTPSSAATAASPECRG